MRPKPPKVFDITPEGYHEHNRYFNEAEKIFDKIERLLKKQPTITITKQGYYSVGYIGHSQGARIIEELMRILFEKDEFSDIATNVAKEES